MVTMDLSSKTKVRASCEQDPMKLEVLESFTTFTACFVEISSTLSGTIYQLSMAQ